MGDNIDAAYAQGITDRLEQDYGELLDNAKNTIADADDLPHTVESSIDVSAIAAVVVKLRDVAARGESHRKAEKEPYLRAGEMVDAFFFRRVKEPLDLKRKELGGRLDVYKQRQLAEERARREAEAAAARKEQERALKEKAEAEAALKRARSVETAALREAELARARADSETAAIATEEAKLATMQKAGKIVGERFEGDRSGQVTMRKTAVVFIDDVAKIDLERLRFYMKEEHILQALRAWAKATNYEEQMPGATVALRESTVVR
jgi:hypothetical protein